MQRMLDRAHLESKPNITHILRNKKGGHNDRLFIDPLFLNNVLKKEHQNPHNAVNLTTNVIRVFYHFQSIVFYVSELKLALLQPIHLRQ